MLTRFAQTDPLSPEDLRAAELRSLPRPSLLETPLGLPEPAAEAAAELGLETVGDLLEHFPHAHREPRERRDVATLAAEEEATVEVVVRSAEVRSLRHRRGTVVEARVADGTGPLLAVWFNQPWVARQIPEGSTVLLHGRLKRGNRFWVSEHERSGGAASGLHTLGRVPVYPGSQRLAPARVRELAAAARELIRHVPDPLPARLRVAESLPVRRAALETLHFPLEDGDSEVARRRLAFEELLLLELGLAARRRRRREGSRARALPSEGQRIEAWLASLPFAPTGDQRAAFAAIDSDLAGDRPMQRLLMGEVGSGKTVVALHAMLRALESGAQAAFMAPTETLAEQHLATIDRLLGGGVPVELLTGSTPERRRREVLDRLASGELGLVVGTHALLEPTVTFRELALAVVDEQHRFGVRQRAELDAKAPDGLLPHVLHMTATPIPRTLSLTVYGDLDTVLLRELPAGRRPVETHVVDGTRARARAYERIREEIAAGRQCFVVCPLVEESETLQAKAAGTERDRLAATELRGVRVELVHGQMPSRQKAEAMAAFVSGAAPVLVATSVIEVGIDVPNATVMLIEAAERYGLSQLHQLRGRVGRGGHEAVCIAFGDPSLPRLKALAEESDGFRLAETDLRLRGAGEVLGTRQSGLPEFRVARLPEDLPLLEAARGRAGEVLERDPDLADPEHGILRDAVAARFGSERESIPA